MNPICDFCERQDRKENSDGVECGAAITNNHPYGIHEEGCKCIYDSDLKDLFVKRDETSINVKDMASRIQRQESILSHLRDKIQKLTERLVKVD